MRAHMKVQMSLLTTIVSLITVLLFLKRNS
jgi:hypothetical protein